ncbi:MAG: WD40 repeat domain-containing protein [Armatimonadota bacterium]
MQKWCAGLMIAGLIVSAAMVACDELPDGAVRMFGDLRMRYRGGVHDIGYLPDGSAMIAVGGNVEIWKLPQGEHVDTQTVTGSSVMSLQVKSDGHTLLIADSADHVREWDLQAREEIRSFDTGEPRLGSAYYSPDETRVLTTNTSPPRMKEFELKSGEELVATEGRLHAFREGIYGPEGKTAWASGSAGSGHVLEHHSLEEGKLLKQLLKDYYTHTRSIALSPDGERLLLGSRHQATEWRLDGYELLQRFKGHLGHAVTAVAYCAEPDQLLTGSRDGSIRRWDRHKPEVLLRWLVHNGHVTHLVVSPDGKNVLSYGRGGMVVESRLSDGKSTVQWARHSGPVQTAAVTPDGKLILSGSTDETIRVWEATSGDGVRKIEGAHLGAYALDVHPNGEKVAVGCKDGVVREFSIESGELLRELTGHLGYIRTVKYSPEGHRLFSTAGDSQVRIWNTQKTDPVILEAHRGGVLCIDISSDGEWALTGGRDGKLLLWRLRTAEVVQTMEGHHGWVHGVQFLGDTGHAVSGGRAGRLIKWALGTGESVAMVETNEQIYDVAATPDGSVVCSAGTSSRVTCRDAQSLEQIAQYSGHRGNIYDLTVTPDARHIISASDDTTLLMWEMPGG